MATAIPFNEKPDFTPGTPDRLSPLVRRVIARNPGPFTYTGTGTYIVGNGEVAIIDPGPADNAHIDALLLATEGEQISHILVTHTHVDHSPGCALLQQSCGAKTYGFGRHGLGRPERLDEFGADYNFTPDVLLASDETVNASGWTLQALHTPGHAANHLSFYLSQENALFCGDAVMGWSTTVIAPPDGSMREYMATLELLMQRQDEIYYPTHGSPVVNPQAYLAALYQHRVDREQQVLKYVERGVNTIDRMVPEIYTELDPVLYPAAAMSLFATVECLAQQGRLTSISITREAEYFLS